MKRTIAFLCTVLCMMQIAVADVFVSDYMSVTKGKQVRTSVKEGVYYLISGIDQANVEQYLYDNDGQVKGTAQLPTNDASTSSYVWTLASSGQGWVISNVGTGKSMKLGSSNGSAIKMDSSAQVNTIHFGSDGYLTILNSNGQAIDMTANGNNPTTWSGTTTPNGSRRLKIYEVEEWSVAEHKSLSLVPAPKYSTVGEGELLLDDAFSVSVEAFASHDIQQEILADVARFITTINSATGFECKAISSNGKLNIRENKELAKEGYILDVTTDGATIEASTSDGVYYAFQSLLRLLPPNVVLGKKGEADTHYALPVCRIEDEPRFPYRGFMLDVSRHFFTIEQVKKMIDLMAIYKMNVFHWHLTDDQGWRAEIKQYPLLTTKGAERRSSYDTPITRIEENGQVYWTGEGAQTNRKYGPFYYTQEEMKEVVRYAAERHIDVLPEVDMPGHFVASLAAYPQFSCHPSYAPEIWINGGVSADVLNVANPQAVQFAKNILTELCEIFPYPYFHIGGDECPTSQWESNAMCQEKLAQMGKTSFRALQTEFIREINEHLSSLGKKIFCWNESITDNGADLDLMKKSGATIMCWNPCQSGAAKAASLGLDAIITEWGSGCYYINRRQSNDYGEPTAAGSGNDPVSATYNYVPVPSNVSASAAKYYKGVQATFWTEHVSSNEYLEYLALPRFMCVAEAGWTPQEMKSWSSFVRRMTVETKMLDQGGYIYARHWMEDYVPRQAPASVLSDGSVVTFTNKSPDRGQCLSDNNGVLNGQGSTCTEFTLEAATSANKFYIKSNVSGLYLYAENGNSGTAVSLSTKKTAWAFDTSTAPGYVAICYGSTSGNAINNNVNNTTKTRLFAHGTGNGASFWAVTNTKESNNLSEGETGRLTYQYYFRGIVVGSKEFSLTSGAAYPSFAEYLPSGYVITSAPSLTGTIHLKKEVIEIPVEKVPEPGRYYSFWNNTMEKYFATHDEGNTTFSTPTSGSNTIFFYSDDALLSYSRGQYIDGAELAPIGEKGSQVSFAPSLRADDAGICNIIVNHDGYLRIQRADTLDNIVGTQSQASGAKSYNFHPRYVISLPVSIPQSGWTTFSAPVAVTIPQECVGYVVTRYDDSVAKVELAPIYPGSVVAPHTGILLRGEAGAEVQLNITESGTHFPDNLLQASVPATNLTEGINGYLLVVDNGHITFRQMNANLRQLPPHSSWLSIESTSPSIGIIMPDAETGIEAPTSDVTNSASASIYNLHGQSLKSPRPGINIINGKKMVVR